MKSAMLLSFRSFGDTALSVPIAEIQPTSVPRPLTRRRDVARRRACKSGAFIGAGMAVAPAAPVVMPAADLLARQVLRDGEIILFICKPSRWVVALSSLRFIAGVLIILCALHLSRTPPAHLRYCVDAGLFAISCRMMWAVLNWMGRLYVLTNLRILRFAGMLHVDVADCPLRKVASTRVTRQLSERLLRLGTIEIHPRDEGRTATAWQMVGRPAEVREQIEAAIRKAKEG